MVFRTPKQQTAVLYNVIFAVLPRPAVEIVDTAYQPVAPPFLSLIHHKVLGQRQRVVLREGNILVVFEIARQAAYIEGVVVADDTLPRHGQHCTQHQQRKSDMGHTGAHVVNVALEDKPCVIHIGHQGKYT